MGRDQPASVSGLLLGMTAPLHYAARTGSSGNCFWTDGPDFCVIVPGTNFAQCRS